MNIQSISLPENFDGLAFGAAFNLDTFIPDQYYVSGKRIYYDADVAGKILTDQDAVDHLVDTDKIERIRSREEASKLSAKNIPTWAKWSIRDAVTWYDANISNEQIDAMVSLADAKVLLKKMSAVILGLAKMSIAMRDNLWPDLPEDDEVTNG